MRTNIILVACYVCFFISCTNQNVKRVAVFESIETFEDEDTISCEDVDSLPLYDDNLVTVPFQIRNGVKTVSVMINDVISVDMIIDTGCSGALISLNEAMYLVNKGEITSEDIVGQGQSMIADGSIVENMVVRLRKLTIGGVLEANNVNATISNNIQAPLLLGNEVLDRVKSISIDNENRQLLFNLY